MEHTAATQAWLLRHDWLGWSARATECLAQLERGDGGSRTAFAVALRVLRLERAAQAATAGREMTAAALPPKGGTFAEFASCAQVRPCAVDGSEYARHLSLAKDL
jgi:hypothetical protein